MVTGMEGGASAREGEREKLNAADMRRRRRLRVWGGIGKGSDVEFCRECNLVFQRYAAFCSKKIIQVI